MTGRQTTLSHRTVGRICLVLATAMLTICVCRKALCRAYSCAEAHSAVCPPYDAIIWDVRGLARPPGFVPPELNQEDNAAPRYLWAECSCSWYVANRLYLI